MNVGFFVMCLLDEYVKMHSHSLGISYYTTAFTPLTLNQSIPYMASFSLPASIFWMKIREYLWMPIPRLVLAYIAYIVISWNSRTMYTDLSME
jgi:hypothetical protein